MSIFEKISTGIFRHVHGNHLVYNTCWEDPRLDRVALELRPTDNVLVITSAGCNALDYVLNGCNHVYAVDMNFRQNAVLELRKAAIKALDYEDFFQMFGVGYHPKFKKLYAETLRNMIPEESRVFWDKKQHYFTNPKRTYYFNGTSGYFARWMNFYINYIGCIRKPINRLLEATSIEEQAEIYHNELEKKFWTPLMRFFLNRDTTLSLLGVPRAQRFQVESQYNGQICGFMRDCIEAVLCDLSIQDNYFWRVYVTGSYTPNCCPEYLKAENFAKLKDGLVDTVTTYSMSVEQFLRENDVPISRFILLDHMDWLATNLWPALVTEWEAILMRATEDTRIIWRSGGYRTDFLERVELDFKGNGEKEPLVNHLKMYDDLANELHQKDRVHTYASFHIADLIR
ncbi:MAG: BtaA family protein [Planctomycetia bacterium]|nr:BtaA family protein [Planctomycetia bacterium]